MNNLNQIDQDWTLFLDRDGVINVRLIDEYVTKVEEFSFQPGALEAIEYFSNIFKKIFIVTNQQGIGKGLMTEDDLSTVHAYMEEEISKGGGRIDAIYFCPALAKDNSHMRKPLPGMAERAFRDYPEVDPKKSIMVGDSLSDIQFAKNAGLHSVFIKADEVYPQEACDLSDLQFDSLHDFAAYLRNTI